MKKKLKVNSKKKLDSKKNSNYLSMIFFNIKKFWKFIWYDDSVLSYVLNLLVAYIFIKFIFFPSLGFLLNTNYPVVAIISGSMEHKIVDNRICDKIVPIKSKSLNFNQWWDLCGYYYPNFNISKQGFKTFDYTNGLNIGDVMILYGTKPEDIKVGDILVFRSDYRNFYTNYGPIIHRVIKKYKDINGKYHFRTKGDHNDQSYKGLESDITEDKVIGTARFRIPYIGYVKKVFYDLYSKIS